MRSASPITVIAMVALCPLAALALAGCETTQDAAARLKVRSERTLAGRKPVEIDKPADGVRVVDATLVRGDGDAAVVVELANDGEQPVNDLPIAVGVKTAAGEKRYLNDGHDLPYFQTHAPALAPGETGTWVFAAKDPVDDGTAFAEVGAGADPPITVASTVPELDVGSVSGPDGSKATVEVTNSVGYPQYDLTVFAWVTKGDRYLAAGTAAAGDLEPDETEPVGVKLIGDPAGGDVHVSAPPTIFQ